MNKPQVKKQINGIVYDVNQKEIETQYGKKNKWSIALDAEMNTWVSGFGEVPEAIREAQLSQRPISVIVVENVSEKSGKVFLNFDSVIEGATPNVPHAFDAKESPQSVVIPKLTHEERSVEGGKILALAKKAFLEGMGREYLGPASDVHGAENSTLNMLFLYISDKGRR